MPSVSLTGITQVRMTNIHLPRSQPPARINKVCTSAPSHPATARTSLSFQIPRKKTPHYPLDWKFIHDLLLINSELYWSDLIRFWHLSVTSFPGSLICLPCRGRQRRESLGTGLIFQDNVLKILLDSAWSLIIQRQLHPKRRRFSLIKAIEIHQNVAIKISKISEKETL